MIMKIFAIILYQIFYQMGYLLHFFVNSKQSLLFSMLKREFNTGWLKKEFKSFGLHSVIDRPLTLCGGKFISIGSYVLIGKRVVLTVWKNNQIGNPELIISDHVELGDDSHITCANKIIINQGVLTGKKVLITDNSHGSSMLGELMKDPKLRDVVSKGPVIIGKNVWIGEKVSIMPGVTIGEGSIIGANSVVTKDIPAFSVAVGCPAKVINNLEVSNE